LNPIGPNTRITAQQLFKPEGLNTLSAEQRKVVDDTLEKLQTQTADPGVKQYLTLAAQKVNEDPKKHSLTFGALKEGPNEQSFGHTKVTQHSEEEPPVTAQITLNPKRIFGQGNAQAQAEKFIGTLYNEFASMFASGKSKHHEAVTDHANHQAILALRRADKKDNTPITGQEIAASAQKERAGEAGGSVLDGLNRVSVYRDKPNDASDSTTSKLVALGLMDEKQAAAVNQSSGITTPRPVDKNRFTAAFKSDQSFNPNA
jgi:hypothetical protein